MGDIVAVLLIPSPEYAEALLADGPCGARMPIVRPVDLHPPDDPAYGARGWMVGRPRDPGAALALAWEGAPVPEGIDRLARVTSQPNDRGRGSPAGEIIEAWAEAVLAGDATAMESTAAPGPLGRIAILDANGRDVTP